MMAVLEESGFERGAQNAVHQLEQTLHRVPGGPNIDENQVRGVKSSVTLLHLFAANAVITLSFSLILAAVVCLKLRLLSGRHSCCVLNTSFFT